MNNQKVWSSVQSGYRLPKPPGCPDKIFAIMSECWLVCGHRPEFGQLAEVLRTMSNMSTNEIKPGNSILHNNSLLVGKFNASKRQNSVAPLSSNGDNAYADFLNGRSVEEVANRHNSCTFHYSLNTSINSMNANVRKALLLLL
jgi:hypothetical protein